MRVSIPFWAAMTAVSLKPCYVLVSGTTRPSY